MPLEVEVPLEVSTKGLTEPEAHLAHRLVRQYAEKLTHISQDIVMCRVMVEKPQKTQSTGNPFRVRVRVTAPGHTEVVVVRDPTDTDMHDTMQMVVKEAFHAVMRQLDDELQRRRGRVKRHEPKVSWDEDQEPTIGFVLRLHRDQDYGFLRTVDGREIYFHRNAVLHHGFDDLRTGTAVRFEAEQGDDGPQATTVQVVSQHGPLRDDGEHVDDPEGWRRHED